MIAEATRRSPLADYADRFSALWAATKGELAIRELPFSSQVNLRADPNDADLMQRLTRSLGGLALPIVPNTVNAVGDRRALWLGPDEWLIVGPENQQEPISEALPVGLEGGFGSIVDTSANRTVLEIRGAGARELRSISMHRHSARGSAPRHSWRKPRSPSSTGTSQASTFTPAPRLRVTLPTGFSTPRRSSVSACLKTRSAFLPNTTASLTAA